MRTATKRIVYAVGVPLGFLVFAIVMSGVMRWLESFATGRVILLLIALASLTAVGLWVWNQSFQDDEPPEEPK